MTDNQPLAQSLLATQTQASDQSAVTAHVLAFQVVQQLTTLVNHADQTTTGVVVFTVGLEVTLQFVDVGGQQCNLHFWRTSVTNSLLIVSYDLSFFLNVESHVAILLSGNCFKNSFNRPGTNPCI